MSPAERGVAELTRKVTEGTVPTLVASRFQQTLLNPEPGARVWPAVERTWVPAISTTVGEEPAA